MEQDPRASDAFYNERRRRMALPEGAGRTQILSEDAPVPHSVIRQHYGHILGGALRNKIEDLDQHESVAFVAPSRMGSAGANVSEFGGSRAALETRKNLPANDRRNMRGRAPQQSKVSDSKFSVSVDTFQPERSSELSEVEALFGGGSRSNTNNYAPTGPLLPERGLDTAMDLGGYGAHVPFNPKNQILNKVASRGRSVGSDYREIESASQQFGESNEDRYLGNASHRGSSYDPQLMQEMARTMADQMMRSFMEQNRGKQHFKEISTTHKFDDPRSKLVEIDGKYYRMDLTPVRFKKGKSSNKR